MLIVIIIIMNPTVNLLLTKREGCTEENWPEVMAVHARSLQK